MWSLDLSMLTYLLLKAAGGQKYMRSPRGMFKELSFRIGPLFLNYCGIVPQEFLWNGEVKMFGVPSTIGKLLDTIKFAFYSLFGSGCI